MKKSGCISKVLRGETGQNQELIEYKVKRRKM
jgi:hypothetical protein